MRNKDKKVVDLDGRMDIFWMFKMTSIRFQNEQTKLVNLPVMLKSGILKKVFKNFKNEM